MKLCKWIFAVLIWMSCGWVFAQEKPDGHVLIITSYNPETRRMFDNLSDFMEQFKLRGGVQQHVWIENMNCKNLSDAGQWKERMQTILHRYSEKRSLSLVLVLGQEAWAAYLAQTSFQARSIPVMCGLVSSNTVTLPADSMDLTRWEPVSKSVLNDYSNHNIVGGIAYQYDIAKNIQLVQRFYPQADTLAFLSDNSFGGVLMRSLFKKEVRRFSNLPIKWIDGRRSTLLDVSKQLRSLHAKNTCLMIGTWRIDSSDNYILANTTYMLRDANPHLPAFSISSTGLGHWALGGYPPCYFNMGRKLADQVCDYLTTGESKLEIVPCQYVIDMNQLKQFAKEEVVLPDSVKLLNQPPSFYEDHLLILLAGVFSMLILAGALLLALRHIRRMNHLRNQLQYKSQELLLAKDKAEESNRLKTAFLANMSHEIRTPLNAIVGFSDLLSKGDFENEESRQMYGGIIRKNSDLLLHLVNDILDLSRIESGRIKMVYDQCDVVELCRMTLMTIEQTRCTAARFEGIYPVQSLPLCTDPQRLKQVLINLLTNAGKFTQKGFIRLSFRIDEGQRMVEFSVTDTGCGIPQDMMERIFDRFEKLNENAQGAGLGLSISRLIVEKLGGRIWVDREYTGGARFVFTHPLSDLK